MSTAAFCALHPFDRNLRARGLRWLAGISLLAALAACGGGGGSTTNGAGTGAGDAGGGASAPATNTGGVGPGANTGTESGGGSGAETADSGVVRVNTTTGGFREQAPAVAQLTNGGYVVAWTSIGRGVCAQRYAPDGARAGGEACIASQTSTNQSSQRPAVAGLRDGGYVIAWVMDDGDLPGIQSRRYDSTGTPVGPAARVNTMTVGIQDEVTAASLEGGGYVIGWTSQPLAVSGVVDSDVYARRYGADGAAAGPEQRVNTFFGARGERRHPAVAAISGGGYVFAWFSAHQHTGPDRALSVYSQRFDADGVPVGPETLVAFSRGRSPRPAISGLAGGGYIVQWENVGQRFAADGSKVGAETAVDPHPPVDPTLICGGHPTGPVSCSSWVWTRGYTVTGLSDGGYVVAWAYRGSPRTPETSGIYAQRFAADGIAAGPATQLATNEYADSPVVSGAGAGGFVVAWEDAEPSDRAARNIYARRFGAFGLRNDVAR